MASCNAKTRQADLAGDIDLHLRNLHQAQCHLKFELTGSGLPIHIRRRMFIHRHSKVPVSRRPATFTPGSQQTGKEDVPKQHGTGTYIPEMVYFHSVWSSSRVLQISLDQYDSSSSAFL